VSTPFLNPPGLNPPSGFTHIVTATGGKTVYVSGQVSLDETGKVVGRGDFRAQVERAFENLLAALAAAGATFRDVVKVTYSSSASGPSTSPSSARCGGSTSTRTTRPRAP